MIPDDEIEKTGRAVMAGLQTILLAFLEGSQTAGKEFVKISVELKRLCEALIKKGD